MALLDFFKSGLHLMRGLLVVTFACFGLMSMAVVMPLSMLLVFLNVKTLKYQKPYYCYFGLTMLSFTLKCLCGIALHLYLSSSTYHSLQEFVADLRSQIKRKFLNVDGQDSTRWVLSVIPHLVGIAAVSRSERSLGEWATTNTNHQSDSSLSLMHIIWYRKSLDLNCPLHSNSINRRWGFHFNAICPLHKYR